MTLSNSHVLVTGAAKRIGRALAESFVACGARVSAHCFRSANTLTEWRSKDPSAQRSVIALKANLQNEEELGQLVESAIQAHGDIHVLINSASVFFPTPSRSCTANDWDSLLDTNLKGQFFIAREVAKRMRTGVIINIADVYGELPLRDFSPYSASKAGLLMLTKSLAHEWAPHIRVNSVSPGPILPPEDYDEPRKAHSIRNTLLGRWGSPQDICSAVKFIIENDYVTGINLRVDGGRYLR